MSDNVNKPSHYNAGEVETIDAIKSALGDAFLDYCRGNVLKYVWRCRHKGKLLEDLRKAAKYLEWAIAEAESEKPSKPQELAIPEGWRELEENEPLSEDDLFDFEGEWVGHEYDPSGGTYSSRIHRRHIRKIETLEPQPIEIPEGWRELNEGELLSIHDLFDFEGEWTACKYDPIGDRYNSRIHKRHIRKIEPTEWIPKVGDKVRVAKERDAGRYGTICDIHPKGELFLFQSDDGRYQGWLLADKLQLIEAAQ